jgi:hypothetical protein
MLRHSNEDTWWQGHVEDTVGFLPAFLELLEMFQQIDERFILVILTCNIRAEGAEFLQLLLHVFCWRLDVGLHPLEVFLVIHFRARISDNPDVLWQELVAVLSDDSVSCCVLYGPRSNLQGQTGQGTR